MSSDAWQLIEERCRGETLAGGHVRLDAIQEPVQPVPLPRPALTPAMERGLHSYLPGSILSRMAAGHDAWLGELRQVTVLFVNLPSLRFDTPLEVAQATMEKLQNILYRYEAGINKLSVDDKGATLVAGQGLPPLTHEDDAFRGVQAALDIQSELRRLGMRTSIGIATGTVFCGSIGNENRREYTLMGDTVNLAARLMQAASDGILCNEATWRRSHSRIQFEGRIKITVKGKSEPLSVFRPRRGTEREQPASKTVVGRVDEQTKIHASIQSLLTDSAGGAVVIEGEAGMGKTCLVETIVEYATGQGVTVLRGGGDAIEKTTPYHAWRSIYADILQGESAQHDPKRSLESVVAHFESSRELRNLIPLLNVVLPFELPENELTKQMDGQVRADNTHDLMLILLERFAADKPVLLVLEDGQWLDSGSASMAWLASQRIGSMLVLLTTRPLGESPPAQLQQLLSTSTTQHIRLEFLNREESRTLVCHRLGLTDLPDAVLNWIYQRAEGHPFLTEEVAYALRECKSVQIADGRLELTRKSGLEDLDFPDTLQGIITSRLDRLHPQQQMVVKTASVIGRVFASRILEDIYPIESDKPQLKESLESLCRLNITLLEAEEPDLAYAFKHGLIREVAYNLMLFAQRRQLHQSIARWYESRREDDPNAFLPLLAHHWDQAGEIAKSLSYFESAGALALRDGAFREASRFLNHARTRFAQANLHDSCFREARLEADLGRAYLGMGELPQSQERLRHAVELLGQRDPRTPIRRVGALIQQILIQLVHRLPFRRIQPKAEAENPLLEAARAFEHLAEIHYLANDTFGFVHGCLRNLNLAERAGSSPQLARAYAVMGLTAGTIPWHALAKSYLDRAETAGDQVDHLPTHAWVGLMTGIYRVGIGDWPGARTVLTHAGEICEEIGDQRQRGVVSTILGATHYFTGEFEIGARIWAELYDPAHRDDQLQQAWSYGGQALNVMRLGRLDSAVELAEKALEMFKENSDRISEITTLGVLAVARLRQQKNKLAYDSAQAAFAQIQTLGAPTSYYLLEGYSAVAEVFLSACEDHSGQPAKCRATMNLAHRAVKLMASYARVFPIGRPRALLWRGRRYWLHSKHHQALKCWRESLSVAESLGMPYESALAHFEIADRINHSPEETTDLSQAAHLFEELKCEFDLKRIERLKARLASGEPRESKSG